MTIQDANGKKFQFKIDLSDEFRTEITVFNFLLVLGFNPLRIGTQYLFCILTKCINGLYLPLTQQAYYALAAEKYGQSQKVVELAISRAFEEITLHKLERVNQIFEHDILIDGEAITVNKFLNIVCTWFVMMKSHEKKLTVFG